MIQFPRKIFIKLQIEELICLKAYSCALEYLQIL